MRIQMPENGSSKRNEFDSSPLIGINLSYKVYEPTNFYPFKLSHRYRVGLTRNVKGFYERNCILTHWFRLLFFVWKLWNYKYETKEDPNQKFETIDY